MALNTAEHIIGKKFGRLTPIERGTKYRWVCRCDCGKETQVRTSHLFYGETKSCGCLKKGRPPKGFVPLEVPEIPKRECPQCKETFSGSLLKDFCSEKCRDLYGRPRKALRAKPVRRASRAKDPARFMVYRVKHRAKQQGIPFDLVPADLIIPEKCPVLGIDLIWNLKSGHSGYHPNSFSVDRIRGELGYVKGNVRVISARANLLKNNATIEELTLVLEDLKKLWSTE